MPKKMDSAAREHAVPLVLEHHQEYPSMPAAIKAVSDQVGIGDEALRKLVRQSEVDSGQRQGVTYQKQAEIKKLKAKTGGARGRRDPESSQFRLKPVAGTVRKKV